MIKTYFIEVRGTTYTVEVEDTVVESKEVKHIQEPKFSKNCIKNSSLFKCRRKWLIK